MRISVVSVMVDDQEKALHFYTEILGFIKKREIPVGEFRWITVVSPEEKNGVELALEPITFSPAKSYQRELFRAGIPWTAFHVKDIYREYERLKELNVKFLKEPTKIGNAHLAILDDTCGNYIQIAQVD